MTKSLLFLRLICFAASMLLSALQGTVFAQTNTEPHAYETEQFTWTLSTCHYSLDKGTTVLAILEGGNWMKDAQGKIVARWNDAGEGWGLGRYPSIGVLYRMAPLPKTMRLSYYDYQEDRFYQLDAELPQEKIHELFTQQTVDRNSIRARTIHRYDMFVIGVAPQGHVVVWVKTNDGADQVELATFKAQPMLDMTVTRYNTTGPNGRRIAPIETDRWGLLSDEMALKPETVAKLKAGWQPSADCYMQQRVKYPWRYSMGGNGHLLEFNEFQGNQERFYIAPWMLQQYQSAATIRGVPQAVIMWFNDLQGRRHSVILPFYSEKPVTDEPDLTPIWNAYKTLFPDRTAKDNNYVPSEQEMATLEIHVGDSLKTFTATLTKGTQHVALPIGKIELFDLAPFANWPDQSTPSAEVIKRLQGGPDVAAQ